VSLASSGSGSASGWAITPLWISDCSLEHHEATGPSFSIGTGLDLQLNRALELRVAQFDYIHSWLPTIHGTEFNQGARFTFGIASKIGTWCASPNSNAVTQKWTPSDGATGGSVQPVSKG
jgi:hypothetical protein